MLTKVSNSMTSYYAEPLLYNANAIQKANTKSRKHSNARMKNNHIMDTVLFIRQPQRNRLQKVTPSTEPAMIKRLY